FGLWAGGLRPLPVMNVSRVLLFEPWAHIHERVALLGSLAAGQQDVAEDAALARRFTLSAANVPNPGTNGLVSRTVPRTRALRAVRDAGARDAPPGRVSGWT